VLEFRWIIALTILVLVAPLRCLAQTAAPAKQAPDTDSPICLLIMSAARANALPVDFFARLIWQESRFRSDEIGPLTRTGARAQGIAQFMPGTAAERSLFEPFNPVEALPKSGEFLAELRGQFGNLGLAAAAYNAGPQRVREFIGGLRDLPVETRNYVLAITGRPVEDWMKSAKDEPDEGLNDETHAANTEAACRNVMASLIQTPNLFVPEAPQSWAPSWCRYLHHPNVNICGSAHQQASVLSASGFLKTRSRLSGLRYHRADTLQSVHLTGLR
jgi:hypothetical protein